MTDMDYSVLGRLVTLTLIQPDLASQCGVELSNVWDFLGSATMVGNKLAGACPAAMESR
jgi:hypothetical protein